MRFFFLFVFAFVFAANATAQERQFRSLELIDGRDMVVEVLSTEPTGLSMRLPQGESLINFELLKNMLPVGAEAYEGQDPNLIWVHAPHHERGVKTIYSAIPAMKVIGEGDLRDDVLEQLDGCGPDFSCMRDALREYRWIWLVTVLHPNGDRSRPPVFRSTTSQETGSRFHTEDVESKQATSFWTAAHRVIDLKPPQVPSALMRDWGMNGSDNLIVRDPTSLTRGRVLAMSFVPAPGHTARMLGNRRGSVLATSLVYLGTGAVAGVLLSSKDVDHTTTAIASGGTFYALSITTNYLTGVRRLKKR